MSKSKATEFQIIQLVCGKNYAAIDVLCKCADKGRFDIVEFIRSLNKKDPYAIDPEMIVKIFKEKCSSDIDKFIALIDKQFKIAKEIRRDFGE